jgi:hypothetical protein
VCVAVCSRCGAGGGVQEGGEIKGTAYRIELNGRRQKEYDPKSSEHPRRLLPLIFAF